MATNPIGGGGRNVTPDVLPQLRRVLTSYDRDTLAMAITVAIDFLDVLDGDPDQDAAVDDDPRGCDPEEDRCEARDDGCGAVYRDGRLLWGADNEDEDHEGWEQSATWPVQK